ncbi:MAG: hypothetical protein COB60_04165 [Flavobacteriaceae bacterium]|nr:MAG: hypothetical protein COB60_04165 [Flavobacteriaceae bacterium]
MINKICIGLLILGLSSCAEHQKKSIEKNKKPNILFLLTDDHRFSSLGSTGLENVKTPNIDKLAEAGTSFNNAYILGAQHGAVCSPSRAMLMTGKSFWNLPETITAMWSVPNKERGKYQDITFPEVLRENGYMNFTTGKHHNGELMVQNGFEAGKAIFSGGMATHFGIGVRDYTTKTGWSKGYSKKEKYSSELFADAAIEFLQHSDTLQRPFMMYVPFTAPHDPRTAPEEYHQQYPAEKVTLPSNFMENHPFPKGEMLIRDEMLAAYPRDPQEIKKHIADYYAMITATDHHIGRIIEALKASGKMENTIIVFSGDNGLAVGQHGLMGKQDVYEHSIGVPLIFVGPGIPKNEKRDALVYLHDVFPTICEMTGLEIPETVETQSMLAQISDAANKGRETIFFTYTTWRMDKKEPRWMQRSIRDATWKLTLSMYEGKETVQLFNLKESRWETNNQASKAEMKPKIDAMRLKLMEHSLEVKDSARYSLPNWGFPKFKR